MVISPERLAQIRTHLDEAINPERRDKNNEVIPVPASRKAAVTLKLDTKNECATHLKEWDNGKRAGFTFLINPRRIQTDKVLERHVESWLKWLAG